MMHVTCKQQTANYKTMFSSLASKSEAEIEQQIRGCDEINVRGLYLQALIEIEEAVLVDNIENLKKVDRVIAVLIKTQNKITLMSYYESEENPIINTNLITLACKYNALKVLEYIFCNNSNILDHLSVDIEIPVVLPQKQDDECHNSFYYAIRSNNVELLDILIKKWPDEYFDSHLDELDEILSKAYEEIKLKNAPLSDEMELFVENILIDLRFFSESSSDNKYVKTSLNNVEERISLILNNIEMLTTEYSGAKEISQKFLLVAKFIAQNIHILKKQLKPTYDRFPWQEMEFCLIVFIRSKMTRHKHNLVCNFILTRKRTLMHLENFALKLKETTFNKSDIGARPLNQNREAVVVTIIQNFPPFEELYNDYKTVADIYSFDKIVNCIELASKANPEQDKDRLVIMRALQVIGECLKNTLDSPNLSSTSSKLLLLSLPENTSEILIDLRNSLSHAHSLSKRTELEESNSKNTFDFFNNIQNDLKKIGDVISSILFNNEIKICRIILKKIINNTNLDEIKEIAQEFCFIKMELILRNYETTEQKCIKNLVKELKVTIDDKTNYEKILFRKIDSLIASDDFYKIHRSEISYSIGSFYLHSIGALFSNSTINNATINEIVKPMAQFALKNIYPRKEFPNIKEIAETVVEISELTTPRLHPDKASEVIKLIIQILYVAHIDLDNIGWIAQLQDKLTKNRLVKPHSIAQPKKTTNNTTDAVSQEKWNNQFMTKLSSLENILNRNAINRQLIENYPSYKSNTKVQAAIEMLVQDIMSILESSRKNLANNMFFIDDVAPLLIGRSLRNHLAHGNALIDIFLFDPLIAITLNARKLVSKNAINDKQLIGKLVKDDPSRTKNKFYQDLQCVENQEAMFIALEEGNVEVVKSRIKKGADINARTAILWTALHFAAKGPSLDVVKFVFNLNLYTQDVDGHYPLHIASVYGRKDTVEFFVGKAGIKIDSINNSSQTPLHLAAQNGHMEVVEFLFKNGSKICNGDMAGFSPVHYAIFYNHVELAISLLKKERNVDANECSRGCSPLFMAAENGHLEIVDFLIQNRANINTKNDKASTPLHVAAMNGHYEVVQALILNGANVNDKMLLNGATPLLCAIQSRNENIVKILLKHGANVNALDKVYNDTPLHIAAGYGCVKIAHMLIENKANVDAVNYAGITPLHFAAINGYTEVVSLLLEHKAIVDVKSNNDRTALHLSSYIGQKSIVELLIKKGSKIHSKDEDGRMPLHLAGICDSKEVIELLITEEANIDSVDKNGFTALHLSCMCFCKDVVEILIKKGAKIDAVDDDDNTPLHVISKAFSNNIIEDIFLQKTVKNIAESKDCFSEKLTKVTLLDNSDISVKNNLSGEIAKLLLDSGANIHAKCTDNFTPLHLAAQTGNVELVEILIKENAEVNVKSSSGLTPLHVAVYGNHRKNIEILIESGANMDITINNGFSSLYIAIKQNYKEVAELLVERGAVVNADCLSFAILRGFKNISKILLENKKINNRILCEKTAIEPSATKEFMVDFHFRFLGIFDSGNKSTILTPLHYAASYGWGELVKALSVEDNDFNAVFNNNRLTPLHFAAYFGQKEIVKILLAKDANANSVNVNNLTSLHLAAYGNHKEIVEILLANGVDVNAVTSNVTPADCDHDVTPLHLASQEGQKEVVEVLLDKGVNVNCASSTGSTPLHLAAMTGHHEVIEILVRNGAEVDIEDCEKRSALTLAAAHGHLQIVEILLNCKKININTKGTENWTVLHTASQKGYLEIVKILIDAGADVNARDNKGSKSVHIAAREGYTAVVEFFLNNGCNIDDPGEFERTLLHYAALGGQLKMAKFLIEQNADVNATNTNGESPLHAAAKHDFEDIIKLLLNNGAIYNIVNNFNEKPLHLAKGKNIINSLTSTKKLFKAVKCANILDVKTHIEAGAFINAKNLKNLTPLHYAAWKGYREITDVLLKNKANANVIGKGGFTPLHYAAKFGHLGSVKSLLSSGAIYNIVALNFKIPIDLAGKQDIIDLLNLVDRLFGKMQKGDLEVIDDLRQVTQVSIMRAVMNATDRGNKTFMIAAIKNDFPKVDNLKAVLLSDEHYEIIEDVVSFSKENYQDALRIYQSLFEKQKNILGPNNPITLKIQFRTAIILYQQTNYPKSLTMFQEIYEKQKKFLGKYYKDTLITHHFLALTLYQLGKYKEALEIFQEVCKKQEQILGPNDSDALDSQLHMVKALHALKRHEEALSINKKIFEKQEQIIGINHFTTLNTLNNVAIVLNNQSKHAEALKIFKQVHEKHTEVLGPRHSDTLTASINIAAVLIEQKQYDKAVNIYQEVFDLQKQVFGADNLYTLNTQTLMGNAFYLQGKYLHALECYKNSFDRRKAILGSDHPAVCDTSFKMKSIEYIFDFVGDDALEIASLHRNDIFDAANSGNIKVVQDLLDHGIDVNIRDVDGRTPLHFAANSNHRHLVRILLENKADATKATIKGNIPLHSAISKGNKEIVGLILEHVKQENPNKLHDLVNAQTMFSGSTSLHIAVKNGCLEIVKLLLKHGAIYNALDVINKKSPLEYSKNQDITDLLNLADQLFDCAKKGNGKIINQLYEIRPDVFQFIANTRNQQGHTPIQSALINKHNATARSLLKLLQ